MAEPFVFHFRPGEGGQPEQMYLADIHAECGLCGHLQVQRYYHSTPLHPISVRTLRALATQVAQKTEFECPNCGSEVGAHDAISTALTWAFADDAGLIRGFLPDVRNPESLRWQFVSNRRLDPQELPGWEPSATEDAFARLTDALVEQALGRPLNPKSAIRETLLDWCADPVGGAIAPVGPAMTIVAAGPDVSIDELADEIDDPGIAVRLSACVPDDLPTHREPAALAGRLDGWIPAEVDREAVTVFVRHDAAVATIDRAFEVANLTVERGDDEYVEITTPRGAVYPRPLPILAVLRRAVYTGLTPGDAARLTAEEIVGNLLRVW